MLNVKFIARHNIENFKPFKRFEFVYCIFVFITYLFILGLIFSYTVFESNSVYVLKAINVGAGFALQIISKITFVDIFKILPRK